MNRNLPLLGTAFALVLALPAAPARAAVFHIPPVTITQLAHTFTGSSTLDAIVMPGPGYTSSGFTGSFGTGDVVRVRIEAPSGKKFVLRTTGPYAGGQFKVNVYWACGGGDNPHFNPWTVTFENPAGIPPTLTYALALANEHVIETWFDYDTHAEFEFTAFQVDIPVDQVLAAQPRTFGDAQSYASWSIGADAPTTNPNFRAMDIVDISPTPARTDTWGALKSLYR
jgi:hypothetical protein